MTTPPRCTIEDRHCRVLWELSYTFAPTKSLKAQLQRTKTLLVLGKVDHACKLYLESLREYPQSLHLLNNAGFCRFRQGYLEEARDLFVQATHAPGDEDLHETPLQNLRSVDAWMADFRAQHGDRTPSAEERGSLLASIMW